MIKKYYMAVTPDEYELPIYVAESVSELAEVLNVKPRTISEVICKNRAGKKSGHKLIKIEVDDD